jgi:hypothetical protein
MNKRATKRKSATENYILKFLTVSSVSSDSIVKGIIDDIINTAVKTAEVDEQKTKYLQHFINKHDTIKLNRDIHFTCIPRLLNNTCVKHNFKSVHVSNLFRSREYNSAKEICKYPSSSKVGGNYPLDLKIIWSFDTIVYSKIAKLSTNQTFIEIYKQGHVVDMFKG